MALIASQYLYEFQYPVLGRIYSQQWLFNSRTLEAILVVVLERESSEQPVERMVRRKGRHHLPFERAQHQVQRHLRRS